MGLHRGIETTSNIAIILVAVVIVFAVANRYFPGSAKPAAHSSRIQTGTKVSIANFEFEKSNKTLVMALSTSCRFCNASVPFYRLLAEQKGNRTDIRLLAVMPQAVEEAIQYLNTNSIAVDEIRQATSNEEFLKATPTLMLVDSSGAVLQSWVGQLPPEAESEVLRSLLGT